MKEIIAMLIDSAYGCLAVIASLILTIILYTAPFVLILLAIKWLFF